MKQAPLYRSVNTRTHGVRHGNRARYDRHTKQNLDPILARASMHGNQHGRDYTPLFRFLLTKVGKSWNEVFAEAKARLDTIEPIFWLVARTPQPQNDVVRLGESSYYSALFVDAAGLLQRVNPQLTPEQMTPSCTCCTHTFNGVRFPTHKRSDTVP